MPENTYQPRTGSLASDVAFLILLIIGGTAGLVWLSTLSSMDFHAISDHFSAVAFLIPNMAGMVVFFQLYAKLSEVKVTALK